MQLFTLLCTPCPLHSTSPQRAMQPTNDHIINIVFSLFIQPIAVETQKITTFAQPNSVKMRDLTLKLIVIMVAIVGFASPAIAQSEEEDYYLYKFYDEDEERYNAALFDNYPQSASLLPHAGAIADISSMAQMGMRSVMNNPRGADRSEERNMVGGIDIDYTTATTLTTLGILRQYHPGISYAITSGTIAPTTTFTFGHKGHRPRSGHRLRTEFSGRNYIVGITQRSTYRLSKGGVERHSDWLLAHSARIRAGRDIYVDGVYNTLAELSLYATRSWEGSTLHLVGILPWSERGSRRASLEEAFTLIGNPMYNPSWGYQAGKRRNSNIATSLRPEALAVWHKELGEDTRLSMVANLSYDNRGYTRLANLKASSPMPDNYRYLPSYIEDEAERSAVTNAWINNDIDYTQIDWEELYQINYLQRDGHSVYLVDNSHRNALRSGIVANVEHRIAGITIHGGALFDYTTTHEFKSVEDLLGGDHILNIDYANIDDTSLDTPPHHNLREGERLVKEGDRYAYDYRLTRYRGEIYGSVELKFGRTSLAASLHVATELSKRRGYYEKSLFPGKGSYGKSQSIKTLPSRINLAWYHHLGKHSLSASAMFRTESPEIRELFLQPQYNNRAIPNPTTSKTFALEASYNYLSERIGVVATAYITTRSDMSHVARYYDDLTGCMVNGVVSNIATIDFGIEASAKVGWRDNMSSTIMVTAAVHRYMRNANVEIYSDANNTLLSTSTSHTKGLRTSTPEITLYGDFEYRPTDTWLIRLAARYWGLRYAEPSLVRRSERILSHAPSTQERSEIMEQQRLGNVVMVDLVASKSFGFNNGMRLMIQISANNLLGSRAIYRSYEQHRILTTATDSHTHLRPMGNMVQYAYPRTFRVMVSLYF